MSNAIGRGWSYVLLLPLLGWLLLLPLLIAFPIYMDEIEWKLVSARMLIDGGKLVYLFPVCARGFLLDVPLSWYPAKLFDAALYADLSHPQILRYWAIAIFGVVIVYAAWFARRTLWPGTAFLKVLGGVCAPLALAVLPFVLVMNRPEQGMVGILVLGCTLPVLLEGRRITVLQAWGLAGLYVLLAWTIGATHIKGLFFLPALLAAGFLAIRRWLPSAALASAAIFGVHQTLDLWGKRTDCPESPFLVDVFNSLSLRPSDFANGIGHFIERLAANYIDAARYWTQVAFQQSYEIDWLPAAKSPLTAFELWSNMLLPIVVLSALIYCAAAIVLRARKAIATRALPPAGPIIGVLLLTGLFGVVSFQHAKNFYEAGLLVPVLGLAVLSLLSGRDRHNLKRCHAAGGAALTVLALCATLSQWTLIWRFHNDAMGWWTSLAALPSRQESMRDVVKSCGIANDATTSRLVVDEFTYSVLWRTREPLLLRYTAGWYATGTDPVKVMRERKASGIVAACDVMPPDVGPVIAKNGFCCVKFAR